MAKLHEQYTTKIEDLRKRLIGDLNMQELEQMQLHIDLLELAAELKGDHHSHDTSEHHDHVHSALFEARTNPVTRTKSR